MWDKIHEAHLCRILSSKICKDAAAKWMGDGRLHGDVERNKMPVLFKAAIENAPQPRLLYRNTTNTCVVMTGKVSHYIRKPQQSPCNNIAPVSRLVFCLVTMPNCEDRCWSVARQMCVHAIALQCDRVPVIGFVMRQTYSRDKLVSPSVVWLSCSSHLFSRFRDAVLLWDAALSCLLMA